MAAMYNHRDESSEPTRAEVDAMPGPVVVEFGAAWCGYCRAIKPHVLKLLDEFPQIRHLVIEDGPGQPLGRSFGVKLWPTLAFLRNGKLLRRLVRPDPAEVRAAFIELAQGDAGKVDDAPRASQ